MRRRSSCCSIVFSLCRCLVQHWLSAFLLLLAIAPDAHAANKRWNNNTGSFVFNTGGNWVGGVTPGVLDVAQFGLSGFPFSVGPYTVSFNNNATNQALHIEDDSVTFNLNSRVYTLTAATGMVVGNQSGGFSGSLTVTNGTISGSTNFDVGAVANRSGTLIVGTNGLISGSPTLNIGKLGTGTLTVQADGDISSTGATNIGVGDGITGTATIFGNGTAGSATLVTGTLDVGSIGDGTVNVQFGGLLQNNGGARLGRGSIFTGTGIGIVNVMNAGSVWNSVGLLEVGDGGAGEVNITLGGKMTGVNTEIGSSSSGEVNVDGLGSLWDSSGTVTVGQLGDGTLNITNQGVVEDTDGVIGNSSLSGSTGTVAVTGAGSRWNNTGDLTVGNAGTGTLNITGGGTVQNNIGYVGFASSGTGTVTVDGDGSLWDNSNDLIVGVQGEGELNITAGGKVQNTAGYVGNGSGGTNGTGTVTVSGFGSLWDCSSGISVGYLGEGTLSITGGGHVQNIVSIVGSGSDATGLVTVDGDGSLWENSGRLVVGSAGNGTLEITAGGHVLSATAGGIVEDVIGSQVGSTGLVTVDGDGSLWENSVSLTIGREAQGATGVAGGTLNITRGGHVSTPGGFIGVETGSTGLVTVDGDNSLWECLSDINVGDAGDGTLVITGGGTVQNGGSGVLGRAASGTGHVNVDGIGSFWDISNLLAVGGFGRGTLEITAGGIVQSVGGIISGPAGSPSAVTVDGAGSQWLNSYVLDVGSSSVDHPVGVGTLDITDGGIVTTDGDAFVGNFEGRTGIVTVAGAGSTWEIGGRLDIGANSFAGNNGGVGTLRIQGGTVNVTEDTSVSAGDLLSLAGGTLSTTAINFVDGGAVNMNFVWTSGTLHVGFFDGDLVNQAGILAPGNSIGFTVIDGNYNQLADATLQIEVGGLIERDTVSASGGNAFLGGDLELSLVNGFVPNSADTILILSAGFSIFNSFANVANGQRLTTSDGLGSFIVNYGPGSAFNPREIVLSNFLAGAVPGDYNQNGTVDAADYTLWRDNLGSSTALANDDTAGVGPDDYDRWKTNFGQSAGSGATGFPGLSVSMAASAFPAVPEPAAILMALGASLFTPLCARRHPGSTEERFPVSPGFLSGPVNSQFSAANPKRGVAENSC